MHFFSCPYPPDRLASRIFLPRRSVPLSVVNTHWSRNCSPIGVGGKHAKKASHIGTSRALPTVFAGPQTLILRDGRTISGTFVSGSANNIVFRDDNGVRRTYTTSEIQSIEFSSGSSNVFGNSGRYGANRGYEGTQGANRGDANRGYSDRAAVAGTRVLPAGTEIVVRTNEDIRSESANSGRTWLVGDRPRCNGRVGRDGYSARVECATRGTRH